MDWREHQNDLLSCPGHTQQRLLIQDYADAIPDGGIAGQETLYDASVCGEARWWKEVLSLSGKENPNAAYCFG